MTPFRPFSSLPVLAKANLLGVLALVGWLSWVLVPGWRDDPDLAHGFFAPLLFLILVFESRVEPNPRFVVPTRRWTWLIALLGVCAVASVALSCLYAASLGWSHAMSRWFLAVGVGALVLALWWQLADSRLRVLSFGWPAVVAALLWPLAAPLPPGLNSRLSLGLQGAVTQVVTSTLDHVGIAAHREGNVIELVSTSVGVSEACSGVRSLMSCCVVGLFLSAVWVSRPGARAVIVGVAPVLALVMNAVRSLILTVLASEGVMIEGPWHDRTGYAILGVTTVVLLLVAHRLRAPSPSAPQQSGKAPAGSPPSLWGLGLVLALVGCMLVGGNLLAHRAAENPVKAPALTTLFPEPPMGWSVRPLEDLSAYTGILRTTTLERRRDVRRTDHGEVGVILYVAFWLPGQAPVNVVDAHTPDTCWPGSGWVEQPLPDRQVALPLAGRSLPRAQTRVFAREGLTTRVWFWHLVRGRPIAIDNPDSIPGLVRTALTYGFQRDAEQLFVSVTSNRPWEELRSEPFVQEFFRRTAPLGL